jgi:electron transfer flavoprotein beta subunit
LYICVCIKQAPDSASVYVDPITGDVDDERFVQVLNPADVCAVEAAVRLKEALYSGGDPSGRLDDGDARGRPDNGNARGRSDCTIKVLTLGPKDAEGALRAALALGADSALRLWNVDAGEWGPFTVAAALAGYLKSETFLPDLVLCGDSSSDWSSGIVGPALAEQLDLPQITSVMELGLREEKEIPRFAQDDTNVFQAGTGVFRDDKGLAEDGTGLGKDDIGLGKGDTGLAEDDAIASSLRVTLQLTRKLERGFRELLKAELPLLITVTGDLNEPRYPSLPAHLAALKAEIPVLDPQAQMSDSWLHGTDEMTLLEIHAPRPLPRHIPAPDSQHSAYQRIGEIVAGGATGRKIQLVEGSSGELAKVLVDFLKNRGFV